MPNTSARPLNAWLREWINSLETGKRVYREDIIASNAVGWLKKFFESPAAMRRLTKSYDALTGRGATDAEQRMRDFLVRAIASWLGGELGLEKQQHLVPPSLRKRKLASIVKKVRELARLIAPNTMSSLIPPGFERSAFLKDRRFSTADIFPLLHEDLYDDGHNEIKTEYPPPTSLVNLLNTFANALNAQVRWLSSQSAQRVSRLNEYVSALAVYCSVNFGRVDRALIVEVVRVVTGEKITADMIRKRAKAGLLPSASSVVLRPLA